MKDSRKTRYTTAQWKPVCGKGLHNVVSSEVVHKHAVVFCLGREVRRPSVVCFESFWTKLKYVFTSHKWNGRGKIVLKEMKKRKSLMQKTKVKTKEFIHKKFLKGCEKYKVYFLAAIFIIN